MSDFTKEELEEVLMWSNHLAGCSPSLVNKLRSMIENYCEHEWQESIHDSDINICIKCGYRRLWTEFR